MTTGTSCSPRLEALLKPELFKALCDPNRLSLLARLAGASAPMTVGQASSCCGVHLSGVSRHLSALRDAGIVSSIKDGRQVLYSVNFTELIATLRGLADALEACCGPDGCC